MTDKTLGDYAVEAEAAMANNTCAGVGDVAAEMIAAAPPVEEGAASAEPPAPEDLGLRGFGEALAAAAETNNVAAARKLCEDMKALYPPSPPVEPEPEPA